MKRVLGSEFRSGRRLPIRRNIVLYEEDLKRLEPFIEEQKQFIKEVDGEVKPNFSAVIRRVIKLAYEYKMQQEQMMPPPRKQP